MAGGPSQDHPLLVLWTDHGLIQGVNVLNQISCKQLFCIILIAMCILYAWFYFTIIQQHYPCNS